jgi:hypothetical protein
MEDTGEDADARLLRVVLLHQHRGYERGVRRGNEQPSAQITTEITRGRTLEKTQPQRKRDRVTLDVAADLNGDNSHDATQHCRLRFCPISKSSGHTWTWHARGVLMGTDHHRWDRHRSWQHLHTTFPHTETAHKTQNISCHTLPVKIVQFHWGAGLRFGVAVRKVRSDTDFRDSALHVSPHRMRWGGRETCPRVRTRVRCVGGV